MSAIALQPRDSHFVCLIQVQLNAIQQTDRSSRSRAISYLCKLGPPRMPQFTAIKYDSPLDTETGLPKDAPSVAVQQPVGLVNQILVQV